MQTLFSTVSQHATSACEPVLFSLPCIRSVIGSHGWLTRKPGGERAQQSHSNEHVRFAESGPFYETPEQYAFASAPIAEWRGSGRACHLSCLAGTGPPAQWSPKTSQRQAVHKSCVLVADPGCADFVWYMSVALLCMAAMRDRCPLCGCAVAASRPTLPTGRCRSHCCGFSQSQPVTCQPVTVCC